MPQAIQIKLAKKIEEIPEKDWESVFPHELENYHFFKALDIESFRGIDFYYLIAYENNIPVGAATLFLMDFQLDMAIRGWLKRLTTFIKKIFPGALGIKILFCGLPMAQGRIGVLADKGHIFDALVAYMERLALEKKVAALVFKDFCSSYDGLLNRLLVRGFQRIASLPTTGMKIEFANFEDYLKSLSRSSREGLKRKLKKIAQHPAINLEITDTISEEVSGQMHKLYMQSAEKSEVEFEELPENFFTHISRYLPDRSKFFLWRLNGKLVSFAYCLTAGDYFIDYYLGFDYNLTHEYNLYFLRFRDLMNWCIINKKKFYEMGQSSYEVKRRLGFEFVPLYLYCRPSNKFFALVFKFYSRFLAFEKHDPVLKLTKTSSYTKIQP